MIKNDIALKSEIIKEGERREEGKKTRREREGRGMERGREGGRKEGKKEGRKEGRKDLRSHLLRNAFHLEIN
jgi:flagellar biosynthesis/type III secretory pathway protein FliH